jgi:hypothetical protein
VTDEASATEESNAAEIDRETEASMTAPRSDDVRAERVEISQGGANMVQAQTVTITQGGAGQVRARAVTITQGGIGVARTDRAEFGQGSGAFAVLATDASIEKGANVFVLFAARTSGDAKPLVDLRAALAIGVGFAVVTALLRRLV